MLEGGFSLRDVWYGIKYFGIIFLSGEPIFTYSLAPAKDDPALDLL